MILDFRTQDKTLFAGRNNGRNLKNTLLVDDHERIIKIFTTETQLVTSSFFLGLFENYYSNFNTFEELKQTFDVTNVLNPCTLDECVRAIHRGISMYKK